MAGTKALRGAAARGRARPGAPVKAAPIPPADEALAGVTALEVKAGANAGRKPALKPYALVLRVYRTIEGELQKLEEQIGTKSQDRERASRALSQVVNSLEKAVEMQREIAKDKKRGGGVKDKETLRHAEDMRRQIAERIERLRGTRTVTK